MSDELIEVEPLTDTEAEATFFAVVEMLDALGSCPVIVVARKEDEGVEFALYFSVLRARKLIAAHAARPSSNEALLREALEKCADDLEAELKARWCFEPDGSCHPALQHKFDRDMVVVNDARKLLAKIDAVLNTVDEPGTGDA